VNTWKKIKLCSKCRKCQGPLAPLIPIIVDFIREKVLHSINLIYGEEGRGRGGKKGKEERGLVESRSRWLANSDE